jgi:DNA replication protein DnaC
MRAEVAAREAEKTKYEAVALERAKATIGVPEKFLAIIASGLRDTPAMGEVKKGGFHVLVLAGDVGLGKTAAASWWALEGIRDRHRPLFVTAARLSRWERYDVAEMDRLLLASRLVIDDLGNEFSDTKGNFLAVLDETISDRVANHRPTVITTNLTPEAFVGRYGERVRDRIRESGRFQIFAGESLRGRQLGLLPVDQVNR